MRNQCLYKTRTIRPQRMKDSASETQKSIIAVTFGEELGNQQRPTLERIDMKLGHFNKQKNT